MKKFILPFVVIMAMMLSSCGVTTLAFRYQEMKENEAKAKASTKTTVPPTIDGPNILNICYNADYPDDCKMDIYRDNTTDKNRAVVMIHGGVWLNNTDKSSIESDKDLFLSIKNSTGLEHKGFHVVNIEYRRIKIGQSNGPTFRDMLEDIRTAVKFIKDHAEEYNILADRLVVYGFSSGAHLVELFSSKYIVAKDIGCVDFSPIRVELCIAKSGISDFANEKFLNCNVFGFSSDTKLRDELIKACRDNGIIVSEEDIAPYIRSYIFKTLLGINTDENDIKKIVAGNQDKVNKASPLYYVKRRKQDSKLGGSVNKPKVILLHGEKDDFVDVSMAEEFKNEYVDDYGIPFCTLYTLPSAGHDLKYGDQSADAAAYKDFEKYVKERLMYITDLALSLGASHDVTFD